MVPVYTLSMSHGNKGIAKWLQGNDGLVEFPRKLLEGLEGDKISLMSEGLGLCMHCWAHF